MASFAYSPRPLPRPKCQRRWAVHERGDAQPEDRQLARGDRGRRLALALGGRGTIARAERPRGVGHERHHVAVAIGLDGFLPGSGTRVLVNASRRSRAVLAAKRSQAARSRRAGTRTRALRKWLIAWRRSEPSEQSRSRRSNRVHALDIVGPQGVGLLGIEGIHEAVEVFLAEILAGRRRGVGQGWPLSRSRNAGWRGRAGRSARRTSQARYLPAGHGRAEVDRLALAARTNVPATASGQPVPAWLRPFAIRRSPVVSPRRRPRGRR